MEWWHYALISYGVLLLVSFIALIIEIKHAMRVPADVDIYDL